MHNADLNKLKPLIHYKIPIKTVDLDRFIEQLDRKVIKTT
jgi:hypothetical protein